MHTLRFSGLGTHWSVQIDTHSLPDIVHGALQRQISEFEAKYSRFLPDSEVSKLATLPDGTYTISLQLSEMLQLATVLKKITAGIFDPNLTHILEAYGYDAGLTFKTNPRQLSSNLGSWEVSGQNFTKTGLVKLDLGAIGKGYLIDLLGNSLRQFDLNYYLVEGGGDLLGTTKADGSAWSVGIEHPKIPDQVIATVELVNSALVTSSPRHRRVGAFHHLLDGVVRRPADYYSSASVIAPSAMLADGLSTALFITPGQLHPALRSRFPHRYLLTFPDDSYKTNSRQFALC